MLTAKCEVSTRSVHGVVHPVTESWAPYRLTCQRWRAKESGRNRAACWAAAYRLMSALPCRCAHVCHPQSVPGADPGICVRGSRAPPLPFLLEVGSPLNQLGVCGERCKLPQQGLGWSSGRKRIWCTLKLRESHWRQSFWVFWRAFFTVVTCQEYCDGVGPPPKGGWGWNRLCPPL